MKTSRKQTKKMAWKRRIAEEFRQYIINVIYLTAFFSIFAWYRRLVLAQYEISYLNYGISLIEALILGKVIMIGDIMRLGKKLDGQPLILVTFYKSIVFTIFVAIFTIIEYAIRGIFGGIGAANGIMKLFTEHTHEFLAKNLIVFCAFIPFFAFKELERIFGKDKIHSLFFKKIST